jgi:putative peptidoglycan lipid II flippase
MVGQSIVAWDDTVLTRCGSVLAVGRPALLNYAKTLMRVPMGVFGQAMGYAAYPTLSRLWVEGKRQELQDTVTTATRRVLFLAFGSQVVLSAAGGDLALMVYTTRRIQPGDFAMLQVLIATFSVALGAWSAHVVIGRGFYAMGKTWLPTWLGTGVLVLAYPIYPLLRDAAPQGAVGLALASSVAVTAYTVILMFLLQRQTGAKGGLAPFLVRTLPATALGIGAGYGVSPRRRAPRRQPSALRRRHRNHQLLVARAAARSRPARPACRVEEDGSPGAARGE